MKQSKLSIIAMGAAVLYCLGLIWMAGRQPAEEQEKLQFPQLGYEETIFDSSYVHTITENIWLKSMGKKIRCKMF